MNGSETKKKSNYFGRHNAPLWKCQNDFIFLEWKQYFERHKPNIIHTSRNDIADRIKSILCIQIGLLSLDK